MAKACCPGALPRRGNSGISDALLGAGAHELPWWTEYRGPAIAMRRNLAETTVQRLLAIGIYHPAMQEALIERAASAGAEVRRKVTVKAIRTGRAPAVVAEANGHTVELHARLVVGADGRGSMVRSTAGFYARRDPVANVVAGLLFSGMLAPDDSKPSVAQSFDRPVRHRVPSGRGSGADLPCLRLRGGSAL